jgi:hypothetical protein
MAMTEVRFDDPQLHLAKEDWDCRVFAVPRDGIFDPGTGTTDQGKIKGPCLCVVVTSAGSTTSTRYEINDPVFWRWIARLLHDTEPDARLIVPGEGA